MQFQKKVTSRVSCVYVRVPIPMVEEVSDPDGILVLGTVIIDSDCNSNWIRILRRQQLRSVALADTQSRWRSFRLNAAL